VLEDQQESNVSRVKKKPRAFISHGALPNNSFSGKYDMAGLLLQHNPHDHTSYIEDAIVL
jgi:hypothetical protein